MAAEKESFLPIKKNRIFAPSFHPKQKQQTIYETESIPSCRHGDTTVVAYFAERDSLVICDTVDTLYIHDTLYLGIGMVDLPNAKIYQHNGEIVVEGAEGNTVTLYDAIGRLLATKRDDATVLRFDVPSPGTYLVRIGAHPARKIVVVR